MTDYSKMSDEDIACLVLKASGYTHSGSGNRCEVFISESGKKYVGVSLNNKFKFDPCNSWADAGPIIQENGICLGYDGVSWDASCHLHEIGKINDWKKYPENPLRMAMIVFLMMKESK